MTPPSRWFLVACGAELSLIAVGAVIAWIWGLPLLGDCRWSWGATGLGLWTSLPIFGWFIWTLRARPASLEAIHRLLEHLVRPWFARWSLAQLALLSAIAGLSEEILFRAVIQGGLSRWLGPVAGLLLASTIFGACHWLTRSYAVVAGLIGVYLGGLWLLTGNLLAPIVTHAVYDFLALVYFLRCHPPSETVVLPSERPDPPLKKG